MSEPDQFEWHDDIIVVPEQAAVAVYTNPAGEVVIRQAGRYDPSEDMWVVVATEHALALAQAIIREAGQVDAESTNPTAGKRRSRAAVEAVLRSQPKKSNRAIAAECGVSDKTVAAVRAEFRTEAAETPHLSAATPHLFPQVAE